MKYVVRVSAAVLLAFLVSYYFSVNMRYWLVLSAFLTSIAPITVPLRERIIVWLGLLLAAVFSSLLPFIIIHDSFLGCLIGGAIGIVFSIIIFPERFVEAFSRGILPSLRAMDKNLQELQNVFISSLDDLSAKIMKLQRVCLVQTTSYPEWVFSAGFNPGLRAGARFFLIKLEQAQEILCALNYLSLRDLQIELIRDEMALFSQSLQGSHELLNALIEYFQYQRFPILQQDFTGDISELENILQKKIPPKLELLELAPEYLALTAFMRELKDLRQVLLQLIAALPNC